MTWWFRKNERKFVLTLTEEQYLQLVQAQALLGYKKIEDVITTAMSVICMVAPDLHLGRKLALLDQTQKILSTIKFVDSSQCLRENK